MHERPADDWTFTLHPTPLPADEPMPDRRADHLVIVSLDAMRPEYYLDPRWPAPTMRELLHEGAHAQAVRSVFPSSSYPGHTTLSTGALPARHGVYFNRTVAPDGTPGRWFYEASSICAPTLWDAAREAGLTTAAVDWPLTAGADIDWVIPDIWPGGDEGDAIEAIRKATRPEGLWEEVERGATGCLRPATYGNHHIASAVRVGMIGAYLFERYRPGLLLLRCQPTTQVMQDPGWWTDARKQRAVAASDRAISEVLETVERLGLRERTAFMIVGDHGIKPMHTQICPNVWLVEAGLRPEHPERDDWRASFQAQAGAAFLRVREPADENAAAVRQVLEGLPSRLRSCFRMVEREELDALGADPDAPFALEAAAGLEFDGDASGPLLKPNPGMTHGYLPYDPEMHTGFIGAGAGFRAGAVTPLLLLQDVAPLAAAVLGLDFHAPDGVLQPGLLES